MYLERAMWTISGLFLSTTHGDSDEKVTLVDLGLQLPTGNVCAVRSLFI